MALAKYRDLTSFWQKCMVRRYSLGHSKHIQTTALRSPSHVQTAVAGPSLPTSWVMYEACLQREEETWMPSAGGAEILES